MLRYKAAQVTHLQLFEPFDYLCLPFAYLSFHLLEYLIQRRAARPHFVDLRPQPPIDGDVVVKALKRLVQARLQGLDVPRSGLVRLSCAVGAPHLLARFKRLFGEDESFHFDLVQDWGSAGLRIVIT